VGKARLKKLKNYLKPGVKTKGRGNDGKGMDLPGVRRKELV